MTPIPFKSLDDIQDEKLREQCDKLGMKLSDLERQVFCLRFGLTSDGVGLTTQQIADKLGISPENAHVLVRKAQVKFTRSRDRVRKVEKAKESQEK